MQITWHGECCFKITEKIGGNEITLVTDPYDPQIGFRLPKLTPEICTISHNHPENNYVLGFKDQPFTINGPGEYEVNSVFVHGIKTFHDKKEGVERGENVIYEIEIKNIVMLHLGALGHILTTKQLEMISDNIDVLFVPVGGNDSITYKEAVEVINQIEPRIVIPMHYKVPGLAMELDSVEKFVKLMGLENPETTDKIKIDRKTLPEDQTKIIILTKT